MQSSKSYLEPDLFFAGMSARLAVLSTIFIAVLALSGCAKRTSALAGKAYTPLYATGIASTRPEARGTIGQDFARAASAKTLGEAVLGWEKFLRERTPADGEFEDSTQKRYLDAAQYELMRVYYLLGRQQEGDELLRKLDPLGISR
jgi:hypothetical protein